MQLGLRVANLLFKVVNLLDTLDLRVGCRTLRLGLELGQFGLRQFQLGFHLLFVGFFRVRNGPPLLTNLGRIWLYGQFLPGEIPICFHGHIFLD